MLQLVVFVSGAILLSLEVIASRLLAPYFGNSIQVWGSVIGVFLAALSLGNAVGGRIADYRPSYPPLVAIIMVIGILTLAIPMAAPPLLAVIGESSLGPEAGALCSAIILFMPPMALMGTISPFAVRLRAQTLAGVGRTAGSLYALSTLGSLAGTFGTAFFLIGRVGVRTSISVMGLIMVGLAFVTWLWSGKRYAGMTGVVVLLPFVATEWLAREGSTCGPIFVGNSAYHEIKVADEKGIRYLWLDNFTQSALYLNDPRKTALSYSDYLHLPLIFLPAPEHVTLIGLGAGTVGLRYVADYARVHVEAVEIDSRVVEVAQRYFGFEANERLKVHLRDGRSHLLRASGPQDIILADAYGGEALPFHLVTREFIDLARRRLTNGGVFALNVNSALEGHDNRGFRAIYKTLASVFRSVYVFPVNPTQTPLDSLRNIVVVATDGARMTSEEVFGRARELVTGGNVSVEGFVEAAASLYDNRIETADVPLLTDDFAPLEKLMAPVKPCASCR